MTVKISEYLVELADRAKTLKLTIAIVSIKRFMWTDMLLNLRRYDFLSKNIYI